MYEHTAKPNVANVECLKHVIPHCSNETVSSIPREEIFPGTLQRISMLPVIMNYKCYTQ